jgi:hypothetical protein
MRGSGGGWEKGRSEGVDVWVRRRGIFFFFFFFFQTFFFVYSSIISVHMGGELYGFMVYETMIHNL